MRLKVEDKKVKFYKQTFDEARSHDTSLDGLELVSMVVGANSENYFSHCLERTNKDLEDKAIALGATHVFGIAYDITSFSGGYTTIGYGDAYKPKEPKKVY